MDVNMPKFSSGDVPLFQVSTVHRCCQHRPFLLLLVCSTVTGPISGELRSSSAGQVEEKL